MANWYYGENDQQIGPMDEASIRAAIGGGKVGPQTLVWREGMLSWLPLSQVSELTAYPVAASPYPAAPYTPYGPYGQPVVSTPSTAVISLVTGILGLVACMLLGIPAVICGHMALKQISESPFPLPGRGMAISGLVMGYLQLLILLGGIVAIVIAVSSQ